ncbi:MAG: alpha/beta hydrolase [Pseudomonadota bacterium]
MTVPDIGFIEDAPRRIAYRRRPGASPTIVFLSGYGSNMEGTKAVILDGFAAGRGQALLRFDYSGTGSSPGNFQDGNLATWLEDSLAAIDGLTQGPVVLVASSMGAWIGLHVAAQRPERVRAFIGIAAAPDFTDWGFSKKQKAEAADFMPHFFRAGEQLALLRDEIAVDCPVRLLHGDQDREVPYDIAMRTMARVRSADVQLNLIKGGGHRLTEPHEIAAILRAISEFLEPAA